VNTKKNIYDICCIGHITRDRVVTPNGTAALSGGTSFYFSHAIKNLDGLNYCLYTRVGKDESAVLDALASFGIEVYNHPCENSVFFENIYGQNQNDRVQYVHNKAEPFTPDFLSGVESSIIHLGPLLADDFSLGLIESLSKQARLSMDVQGFLREVNGIDVMPVAWKEKEKVLPYIYYLKANEHELEVLSGSGDIRGGMRMLYELGVKEVIITLGSRGSLVYDGSDYHSIPAYLTDAFDATGCGDTYMGGYLYKRLKGANIVDAGKYGAAMASLKIQHSGPFEKTASAVEACIASYPKNYPQV
jgi:sugar/nucleoside kinase (ribokinase family)